MRGFDVALRKRCVGLACGFDELGQLPRRRCKREPQPLLIGSRRCNARHQPGMRPAEGAAVESPSSPWKEFESSCDARVFLKRPRAQAETFRRVVRQAHESQWPPEAPLHERRDELGLDKAALRLASGEQTRFAVKRIGRRAA